MLSFLPPRISRRKFSNISFNRTTFTKTIAGVEGCCIWSNTRAKNLFTNASDEASTRGRGQYLHYTLPIQETKVHVPGGIRTRNSSDWPTAYSTRYAARPKGPNLAVHKMQIVMDWIRRACRQGRILRFCELNFVVFMKSEWLLFFWEGGGCFLYRMHKINKMWTN